MGQQKSLSMNLSVTLPKTSPCNQVIFTVLCLLGTLSARLGGSTACVLCFSAVASVGVPLQGASFRAPEDRGGDAYVRHVTLWQGTQLSLIFH